MAKRRLSTRPTWLLKVALVPVAILVIFAVYALASVTESMFARMSTPLELVILVAVLAILWVGRRFFARDFAALDRARIRSATPRSGGSHGEIQSESATRTALRNPAETTALAEYLEARAAFSDVLAGIDPQVATDLQPSIALLVDTDVALEHLQLSVAKSTNGVRQAVSQLTHMCELVSERIETDRRERRVLADALMALAQSALAHRASPSASTGPGLPAGSVFAEAR